MDIPVASVFRSVLRGVALEAPAAVATPAVVAAILDESYEAEEASVVARSLRPGDRVLEIGAGLGFISTLIARDPRVAALTAVEADPRMAALAAETLNRNGARNAEVLTGLFSHERGDEARFNRRADFWMSSAIETDIAPTETVATPRLSLDDTLAARGVTFLVCDIEGGEIDLLARADLSGVDRAMVELHDHVTGLTGVSRLFVAMAEKGLHYDPRCSLGPVVLFRRAESCGDKRPYGAC